jgi:hypothetical protein
MLDTSLIIIKITYFAGDIGAVEDADDWGSALLLSRLTKSGPSN